MFTTQEIYTIYRAAIDAFKVEIGYQDVRKKVLTQATHAHAYVMKTHFETKGRLMDRAFFENEWYPIVKELLTRYSFVVGTITSLPTGKKVEGHYMTILFDKKAGKSYLFDSALGKRNSETLYETTEIKNHVAHMLLNKMPMIEVCPYFSCQYNISNHKDEPIHVDTFCQTWSVLMVIEYIKEGNLDKFCFGRGADKEYNPFEENLKIRHDIFIQRIRENILPFMNARQLQHTFESILCANNKKLCNVGLEVYNILNGTLWPEYTYYFFRDTPYDVDANGRRISLA